MQFNWNEWEMKKEIPKTDQSDLENGKLEELGRHTPLWNKHKWWKLFFKKLTTTISCLQKIP